MTVPQLYQLAALPCLAALLFQPRGMEAQPAVRAMTIHSVEEFIRHSVVDRATEALARKGAVASFLVTCHRAPPQDG